ncbi:MAG TPA: glycosyltransferase family 2 protein [Pyrinomonadaceae bacterium]|nr:glycosyltransferase family 2 protein [Pyrinomonadaceae bacterium]
MLDSVTNISSLTDVEQRVATPFVSMVIPCLNEERFIRAVLESLSRQYEPGCFEIIVVDGISTDRTREVIAAFAGDNPRVAVKVIDNPDKDIPKALNLGIDAATGDIIVRMDAHSIPSSGYVRRCVKLLTEGDAAVVGMPWKICAGNDTVVARGIALAVAHPFGIGDAKYRLNVAAAEYVDTVPFGAFKKTLWQRLGGFNEKLLANEDYDFNYRVRKDGGKVLLDAAEHCDYVARATLGDLAKQYWRYGGWKAQMVKLQPASLRWRHLVAPAFVASVVITALASIVWWPATLLFLAVADSYVLLSLICSLQIAARARSLALFFVLPLIFLSLHLSWGTSFIAGLFTRRTG